MDTSAEARIVASFTFVTALVFGAWGGADFLASGPPSILPEPIGRFVVMLLPVAATAVAYEAGTRVAAGWARTLSGATVMLGLLASLAAVLWYLGSLVNGYL